ncbi:hypothetical protein EJ05DRAFT_375265 [Pseudovirgaria hyperparasitica]|uniref:Uncharacterized protein n=1 Tax=Pseudovirgaria hyperparasitica TaxID=470096 RepID=A0A6A6W7V8_9PEZI|nr:uncharacterized protein EJ05DRAFT_375265 [Pseudovirgaria hyperparasitica]KAF2758040.1 hypothetical protein EJ05DRAFT_375265 [Pseudovirgaria hyperparasitica]
MAPSQHHLPLHHRRTPSQQSRSSSHDGSLPDQSAYRTTVNSHTEDIHLAPPPLFFSGGRNRNRKPAGLRDLMRRRTEGDSEEQQDEQPTSGNSASLLSPNYQTEAQPIRSAPPTVTTYQQAQRSHSQPPGSRAVSNQYPSPISSFDRPDGEMYGQASHASEPWANNWSIRPASTYPPPHASQHYDERPHSYYAGQSHSHYQPHASYTHQEPYHTYQSQSQLQPQLEISPQPSQMHRESVDEGFDDPTESAMFAEALSGFSGPSTPFTLQSPQSPPAHTAYLSHTSLLPPASRPPPIRTQTANLQQTTSNVYLQPSSSYSYSSNVSFNDNRSPNHAMNLAILSISGDEEDRPPDEELPNYAQSQAEEAARRRYEAASRAAELEQRWAAGRRRH